MTSFSGRNVVLTGAAGNLGQAVASAFIAAGATVALIDVDGGSLSRAYANFGQHHHLIAANILDSDAVSAAITGLLGKVGRIDVLCNLAGGFRMGPAVHETPPDMWQFLVDLNATSIINMSRAIVPSMLSAGGGKIVNVAAQAALSGKSQMGAYCASKSAVIRLTESMAAELREKHINVNCIMPSIIDTPQNRQDMPGADFDHWVTPAALAEAILFLASDSARAIHGAALPVYGLS